MTHYNDEAEQPNYQRQQMRYSECHNQAFCKEPTRPLSQPLLRQWGSNMYRIEPISSRAIHSVIQGQVCFVLLALLQQLPMNTCLQRTQKVSSSLHPFIDRSTHASKNPAMHSQTDIDRHRLNTQIHHNCFNSQCVTPASVWQNVGVSRSLERVTTHGSCSSHCVIDVTSG